MRYICILNSKSIQFIYIYRKKHLGSVLDTFMYIWKFNAFMSFIKYICIFVFKFVSFSSFEYLSQHRTIYISIFCRYRSIYNISIYKIHLVSVWDTFVYFEFQKHPIYLYGAKDISSICTRCICIWKLNSFTSFTSYICILVYSIVSFALIEYLLQYRTTSKLLVDTVHNIR